MITNVKEVMDFVYDSYFKREVIKTSEPIDGSHPGDDRNTRKPEITANMLKALGSPDKYGINILVTGSKGKGSVSRLLEQIIRSHGLRTGLFTSPHLHTYNERICINGEQISDDDLVDMANLVSPVSRAFEMGLSQGDYISPMGNGLAIALTYFMHMETQYNILECGRGARFDDVSTAKSDYAVINIIFDEHLPYLGQSIADVAWHKAGVISAGQKHVFSAMQEKAVDKILSTEAAEKNVPLTLINAFQDDIEFVVEQSYNKANANLAYTAAKGILGSEFNHEKAMRAIREFPFSGCLEMVSSSPRIFMDGCIHPVCASEIAKAMNTKNEIRCIIGIPDNKAYKEVVEVLKDSVNCIILSEPEDCHLPFDGAQADYANKMKGLGNEIYHIKNLGKAIDQALTDLPDKGEVYIIGTQIYLGQAKTLLGSRGLL